MTPKYRMLTEQEVSDWFQIPVATLQTHRNRKRAGLDPIPFVKLPNGSVRYREDMLLKWLERNTFFDTAEHTNKQTG